MYHPLSGQHSPEYARYFNKQTNKQTNKQEIDDWWNKTID